jgi:hypothetical protein
MPIPFEKFDLSGAKSTGGVTGSRKVELIEEEKKVEMMEEEKRERKTSPYQLKSSILDQKWTRQWRAEYLETENFGEVIGACVGEGLSSGVPYKAVPEVSLVYDSKERKMLIASKYISGVTGTLDDFVKSKDPEIKTCHFCCEKSRCKKR